MHNQNNVLCELGNLLIEYQMSRLEESKEDTDATLASEPVSSEMQQAKKPDARESIQDE